MSATNQARAELGDRQAAEVFALFTQSTPSGARRFSEAEVRHFMPMALLATGHDVSGHPELAALMREFVQRLKLAEGSTSHDFVRAVHIYYARNPPNQALEAAFLSYCRSQARGELDAHKVRAYAKTAGLKLADASPIRGMAIPTGGLSLRRR